MKLVWSKSDAKRARKMGWCLLEFNTNPITFRIFRDGIFHNTDPQNIEITEQRPSPFKSDREAAEWVCNKSAFGLDIPTASELRALPKHKATSWRNTVTARKAVLLCCLGGTK